MARVIYLIIERYQPAKRLRFRALLTS